MRRKLSFLCVGFQKSGTSTLDAVLRQHSQIKLPIIKETQYFYWRYRYRDSKKIFRERFFDSDVSGICGVIEPEFQFFAKEIYESFGKNVKLIFIMRNPIERLYSDFKMQLRMGSKLIWSCYSGRTGVAQMFEKFLEKYICDEKKKLEICVDRGNYMKYIKQFLVFFPRENMKFILFEDYVKDPQKITREIQDFLGVDYEELDSDIIKNQGNGISRNAICLFINYILTRIDFILRTNRHIPIKIYRRTSEILELIRNYLCMENKDKMSGKARKICEDFYRDDKKELEQFLQRDLSGLWFE